MRIRSHLFSASIIALAFAPIQAAAREVAAEADADADASDAGAAGDGVQAIVVEATRRSERASDVPLALSVLTGANVLERGQIKTTNDVVESIPNAQALQPHGPSRARWFVRGIGTNNTGNNTINPLGIYYDDVYIADVSNQGYPLYDIERVEVLSGPQGTLWGKNSNAGAINFISRAPQFTPDGLVRVEFGSFAEKRLEAAVGGPLIDDKLAARAAVYYNDWNGWQKNRTTGGHHPGATEIAGRVQLLAKPTETLSIQLNAHFRDYSGAQMGTNYSRSTVSTSATPAFLSVYPNRFPTGDRYETYSNPEDESLKARGLNAKIKWDLGFADLVSITAYERNVLEQDTSGSPIPTDSPFYSNGGPFSLGATDSRSEQYSQELRLASPADQRLSWLAGLYAFDGKIENRAVAANYVRGGAPGTANAWGTGPQFTDSTYSQKTRNFAFFGNLSFKVSEAFRISGGARWSHEKSSFDWTYGAANIVGSAATFIANLPQTNIRGYAPRDLIFAERATQKAKAWTYDITPEYVFSEQVRIYGRYAHGILPGGYTTTGNVLLPTTTSGTVNLPLAATGAAPTAIRANQIFALNPEKIDSYEVGLKTSWFDRKLTIDLTAFYYDYTNLVVNVPTQIDPLPANPTVLFRNAGAAEIKGIELRLDAAPVKGLTINASFGYLDSEYTKDFGETATILGARTPRTSKFTASLAASYTHEVSGGGSLTYAVDGNWRSKFYFYPTIATQITNPDPLFTQEAYAVANARIAWAIDADESLTLAASVQNLTNKQYKAHALPISSGFSNQIYGRPRSYLLSATAKF